MPPQVLGIKLLVGWLLGLATIGTTAEMNKGCSSVVRLLGTMLEHEGDLNAKDNISYVTDCVDQRTQKNLTL